MAAFARVAAAWRRESTDGLSRSVDGKNTDGCDAVASGARMMAPPGHNLRLSPPAPGPAAAAGIEVGVAVGA